MKTRIGVVLAMVVLCGGPIDAKTTTLSGWVSDESCGRAHITQGTSLVSQSVSAAAPAWVIPNGCFSASW